MTAPAHGWRPIATAGGWQAGAEAMRAAIARWHDAQSQEFSALLKAPNTHLAAPRLPPSRPALRPV